MGLFDDILDTTVKVAGVTLSVAGGGSREHGPWGSCRGG